MTTCVRGYRDVCSHEHQEAMPGFGKVAAQVTLMEARGRKRGEREGVSVDT